MTSNSGVVVEQVFIKVNGQSVDEKFYTDLIQVEVESSFEVPDMAVVTVRDDDLQWLESKDYSIGKSIEIQFPVEGSTTPVTVMKGEITSVEPEYGDDYSATLTIRGYDKRHRMNRGTTTAAWQEMDDKTLAGKPISDTGGLSISADTVTGGARAHAIQDNQTNFAFFHQLARANGFEVYADDTTINFKKAETARGSTVTMEWGASLRSFRPRASAAGQVNEVKVRGWDPAQKAAIIGSATSSTVEPDVDLGGSGGTVAQNAFGAATLVEVRRPVATQNEADALAKGILNEINAGFIEAEGLCDGNPKLLSGVKVTLQNLGSQFNGTYLITTARHVYSSDRYYTEFSVSGMRPRLISELASGSLITASEIQRWYGVVPAIVTNVNDPDDMGRVKLKYPWLDDSLESGWARVAMMGAGSGRGFNWLPEVDDEVVVAFQLGDINYPYVIGGVYNGSDAVPDAQKHAQDGKIEQRTIKTRAGHVIRFTAFVGEA
ncbi:MAG: VgrG-related protein, partial [Chloroflexota bacterium]